MMPEEPLLNKKVGLPVFNATFNLWATIVGKQNSCGRCVNY